MNTSFSTYKAKYRAAGLLSALFFAAIAIPAFAATSASLSPATSSVAVGSQFSVSILVDPKGATDYAEKIEIDYPADALSVVSFTYANVWMPLAMTGYDNTDDTQGVLTKTADYPGGFSSLQTFGTVTFLAKKVASGSIKVGEASTAFETSANTPVTETSSTFYITPAPSVAASSSSGANQSDTPQGAAAISAGLLTDPTAWIWACAIVLVLIAVFFTLPLRMIMGFLGIKKKETNDLS